MKELNYLVENSKASRSDVSRKEVHAFFPDTIMHIWL